MKTDKDIKININRNIIAILFFCVSCTLAGCGQKGPLFLPEPERASKPEPVSSTIQTNTEATLPDKTPEESEQPDDEKEKVSDKN